MVKIPMKDKKLLVRVCLSSGHTGKLVWVASKPSDLARSFLLLAK